MIKINFARRPNGARPTRLEAEILAEIRASGGVVDYINDHGPQTDKLISRLVNKGWLISTEDNRWRVSETAPQSQKHEAYYARRS